MERRDNYRTQARNAKRYFLGYDQELLIRKLGLRADDRYLYVEMLCKLHRIHRETGDIQKQEGEAWVAADSHAEVMTLLDLVCDSRDDRWLSGKWQNMQAFGLQFHQNLLEESRDPAAVCFDRDPGRLVRACRGLGGEKISGGDYGFAVELFDGLKIGVLFWHGDEEFLPRLRFLWDANAKMYIRYETMHFAVGMLRKMLTDKKWETP